MPVALVAGWGRSHWDRMRPGKARRGGPGSQETSSDRQADSPRGRGGSAPMKKTLRTGVAGCLLALAVAAPATAATVTVRVEGAAGTPARQVVTTVAGATIDKSGSGGGTCGSNTAGGALELATGGDWSGPAFSFGQTVDTIKREAHVFMS